MSNISSAPCTIYGYGTFEVLDRNGNPLQVPHEHIQGRDPKLATIVPNKSASKVIEWTMYPIMGGPTCVTPQSIRFAPQSDQDWISLPWGPLGDVCSAIAEDPWNANG